MQHTNVHQNQVKCPPPDFFHSNCSILRFGDVITPAADQLFEHDPVRTSSSTPILIGSFSFIYPFFQIAISGNRRVNGCSLADNALHINHSSMRFHNFLHNGQAEACSSRLGSKIGIVDACKSVWPIPAPVSEIITAILSFWGRSLISRLPPFFIAESELRKILSSTVLLCRNHFASGKSKAVSVVIVT